MKAMFSTAALVIALALGGCGEEAGDLNAAAANESAPLPQIAAPNNGDWREIASRTDEGFLLGNPNAPVKLVEYASFTCHVCAAFAEAATDELRDTYIRSGQVSWEIRTFLRNGPDAAFSLLTYCQEPAAFFRTADQIFEQQEELVEGIDQEEAQRIGALPPEQQLAPLARAMELDTFFARRGMPESRANQCLQDQAQVQRLTDVTSRASRELQVQGTPTFFINDEKQQVTSWDALEPQLRAAIGG